MEAFCFALFSSVFSGERRFQSSAHPREKEPSCISRRVRCTLSRTKQGLKIVASDRAEGGAGQAGFLSSHTAAEAPIKKPVAYVAKSSSFETGRPGFEPHCASVSLSVTGIN